MLFAKKEKDYGKRYPYDEDFPVDRTEDLLPFYFVDEGKRKGRILIEKQCYNCLMIWSVKIYEQYRGNGLGKQMLNETLEYITKNLYDTRKIGLYVYQDNEIAISLYQKLGFSIIKAYQCDNTYFMEKILKNT